MKTNKTPAEARRFRALLSAVLMFVTGVGLGVTGALLIKSPEEAALEKVAPILPLATSIVERGVLGESFNVDAVFASNGDQLIPTTDLDGIVTAAPSLEGDVVSGAVVLEISSRPIFAIAGDATVSRDFVGGTHGDDVIALQSALAALNYDVGSIDGLYGAKTAAAVQSLYIDSGYEPPTPESSSAEVAVAKAAVGAASSTLRELQANAANSADIAVAAADLALAQETLEARQLASLTPFPATEVVFLRGGSFEIVASSALVGGPATKGLIVLASRNAQTLWASVPRSVATRLAVGSPVAVTSVMGSNESEVLPGTVSWIALSTGPEGVRERFGETSLVSSDQVGIELKLASSFLRTDAGPLRATIEVGSSEEPSLIVPLASIRTSADGRTYVSVKTGSESGELAFTSIEVTVLETLSGRASVASVQLREGDYVAIP